MKAAQAKYHLTHPLIVAYQQCWQKLDKYYLLSDEAHQIYAAATLFSPFARKAFFDKNWDQKWLNQMLETVKEHYKVQYADTGDTTEAKAQDDPSLMDIELGLVPNYKGVEDQFKAYIDEPPLHYKVDLFNWWAHSGFPKLRQMTFDLISIPAMSADVERVFSSAKQLLTPGRNRINSDSLEKYELLRDWWLHDLILQTPTDDE